MDHIAYHNGRLHMEAVDLTVIAERYGTPCYVYSKTAIVHRWQQFDSAFGQQDHLVCYAVKANSNLALLQLLARMGSGFDIVSGGELARVLRAGGEPAKIVFSGVAKSRDEIQQALAAGIYCFNVESEPELVRINEVATELGVRAPVSLRINPDVDANTHPYISTGLKDNKFGIAIEHAAAIYQRAAAMPQLDIRGVDVHIGSQLTTLGPFTDALTRVLKLVDALQADGIRISHIDLGGGLGVCYRDEEPPDPQEYIYTLLQQLGDRGLKVLIEPGRAIVANAGVLVTRVEYLKQGETRNFALVDAGMNDLLRPTLYNAWHNITPLVQDNSIPSATYDIVGPVCETGDWLGKDRTLAIRQGDLLAIHSVGAYGFVMSSSYNSRPRAAEILVSQGDTHLIRARETVDDLLRGESLLP